MLYAAECWARLFGAVTPCSGRAVLGRAAPSSLLPVPLPRAAPRIPCAAPPDPLCCLLGHTAPGEEEKALVVCQVQGRPRVAAFACGKAAEYNNISWVAVVAHSEKVIKKEVYESGAGFFFFLSVDK